MNERWAELTGYFPYQFSTRDIYDQEREEAPQKLTASDERRLLNSLREDTQLQHEIRLLHAQLLLYDELFQRLISQAEGLLTSLE